MSYFISAFFKLLDFCLYFFDIVSDILLTKLFYENCHYNYFAFSISCLVVSYLTTVIFLIWVVHEKEKCVNAIFYPFIAPIIVMKKVFKTIACCKFTFDTLKYPFYMIVSFTWNFCSTRTTMWYLHQRTSNWSLSQWHLS